MDVESVTDPHRRGAIDEARARSPGTVIFTLSIHRARRRLARPALPRGPRRRWRRRRWRGRGSRTSRRKAWGVCTVTSSSRASVAATTVASPSLRTRFTVSEIGKPRDRAVGAGEHRVDDGGEERRRRHRSSGVVHDDHVGVAAFVESGAHARPRGSLPRPPRRRRLRRCLDSSRGRRGRRVRPRSGPRGRCASSRCRGSRRRTVSGPP